MLHGGLLTAVMIFILTYTAILSEKINRTAVALFGAILMVVFHVISQEYAFDSIDFNTIGLLIGMMIIVNILKRTGVFQYVAIKAAKLSRGEPWKIMIAFCVITAISSALLDNVTTVLLVVPVTLVITDSLKVNPLPFLIPEIFAANIGGTATLIGDPPNIMIGGATELGFLDFFYNLAPVAIAVFVITLYLLRVVYKKSLVVKEEDKLKVLSFDEAKTIQDKGLLIRCGVVLGITTLGFILHQYLALESATVALFGAALLLIVSKVEPEEVLLEIEWTTIFFFVGLFILVGSLEKVGVISYLAKRLIELTQGDLLATALAVLWISAVVSAFLDNIPFVATMIPLIKSLTLLSPIQITPLWWALALGACLGGNGTLIGASANVVIAGMAERHGYKISFWQYLKIGFPLMLLSIIISSIYLIIFYL